MAAQDFVEGMFERGDIQPADKPECHGDIVTGAPGVQALEKPQSLLSEGEGNPVMVQPPRDLPVPRRTGSPLGQDPVKE